MIARLQSERGTTLIETAVAVGILLVVMAGLLSVVSMSTNTTENHGHLEARATEYAQDKMEQLLGLAYGDTVSDTVTFPAGTSGGSGLTVGGGVDPTNPVNLYVDWLAADGTLLGGGQAQPGTWFYERVWQVSCLAVTCTDNPTLGLKQITVTVTVRSSLGGQVRARATVSSFKTSQF